MRRFYTQTLLQTEAFTHKRFYTQSLLHTQTLLHTEAFTHRRFYTQVAPAQVKSQVVRELQPFVRVQILIQDLPNALVSDSTSELLSPSVVLL